VSANDRNSYSRTYSMTLKVSKYSVPVLHSPMASPEYSREHHMWPRMSQDLGSACPDSRHRGGFHPCHEGVPASSSSSPMTSDGTGSYIVECSIDVLSLYLSLLNVEEQRASYITTTVRNHAGSSAGSCASPSPAKPITSPLVARPNSGPPHSIEAELLQSPYSPQSTSRSSHSSGGGGGGGSGSSSSPLPQVPHMQRYHYRPQVSSGGLFPSAASASSSRIDASASFPVGMHHYCAVAAPHSHMMAAPNAGHHTQQSWPRPQLSFHSPTHMDCHVMDGVQYSDDENDEEAFLDNPLLSMWQSESEDDANGLFAGHAVAPQERFGTECGDDGRYTDEEGDCLRSSADKSCAYICGDRVVQNKEGSVSVAEHILEAAMGGMYEC
jgi:hypothetical protein